VSSAPETPADSPLTMEDVLASPVYRDLMTPKLQVGDPAYAFELPSEDGEIVRLADFAGRVPIALVFGSYT
jgi:peroxiredoxin